MTKTVTPRVIGLSGYARSGKDTAAAALLSRGYRLASFGPIIMELLTEIRGITVDVGGGNVPLSDLLRDLGYEKTKEIPVVRAMMQDLGTAVNRRDPMFWSHLLHAQISDNDHMVITGVRSVPQAEAIRESGGTVIWIDRPGYEPMNDHENETSFGPDDADLRLGNTGTVADLHTAILRAINHPDA